MEDTCICLIHLNHRRQNQMWKDLQNSKLGDKASKQVFCLSIFLSPLLSHQASVPPMSQQRESSGPRQVHLPEVPRHYWGAASAFQERPLPPWSLQLQQLRVNREFLLKRKSPSNMFETIVKQGAFSERRIIALCWTGCVIAAVWSYLIIFTDALLCCVRKWQLNKSLQLQ